MEFCACIICMMKRPLLRRKKMILPVLLLASDHLFKGPSTKVAQFQLDLVNIVLICTYVLCMVTLVQPYSRTMCGSHNALHKSPQIPGGCLTWKSKGPFKMYVPTLEKTLKIGPPPTIIALQHSSKNCIHNTIKSTSLVLL